MKKMTMMLTVGMLAFGLAGCVRTTGAVSVETGTQAAETVTEQVNEKPEVILIRGLNGNREETEVEVPYDPERIAILDIHLTFFSLISLP